MPSAIDEQHSVWRTKLVDLASKSRVELSHGQAAKLINIYLKSIFVCGGFHEHTHVKSLHPPIDRILLQEMLAKGFGDTSNWKKVNWTKLTSDEYQKVIDGIRSASKSAPMWEIEKFWLPVT